MNFNSTMNKLSSYPATLSLSQTSIPKSLSSPKAHRKKRGRHRIHRTTEQQELWRRQKSALDIERKKARESTPEKVTTNQFIQNPKIAIPPLAHSKTPLQRLNEDVTGSTEQEMMSDDEGELNTVLSGIFLILDIYGEQLVGGHHSNIGFKEQITSINGTTSIRPSHQDPIYKERVNLSNRNAKQKETQVQETTNRSAYSNLNSESEDEGFYGEIHSIASCK